MRAKASSLLLVKSAPGQIVKRPVFRTDEVVPQDGIYRVRHSEHRLPHEVTLLKDQRFPKCANCQDSVLFEFIRGVIFTEESLEFDSRIRLYELPVMEEKKIAV